MAELDRLQHPCFSRFYVRISKIYDDRGGARFRERLLEGLSGRVVEIGAGHGPNFAHYPATVTEVLAVEPDDSMRAVAAQAAERAPVPIRIVAGRAEALPAADGEYDAAVFCFVLCTLDDPRAALAEAARVVGPGGGLRFYEHVRSPRVAGMIQDVIAPIWRKAAGGCHPNRDTAATITSAGFDDIALDTFGFFGLTHILGRASVPHRLQPSR
jgi:ubiquinone/menaquinone biosynthesis C-methylase UbiE